MRGRRVNGLLIRAAKAVALLELIQDTMPTDAKLVAQCLYDRGRSRQPGRPTSPRRSKTLRRHNLLGYSEKQGYKIQSSAGEEWERERRDIGVARETDQRGRSGRLEIPTRHPRAPKLQGRPFPWAGMFSDGRRSTTSCLPIRGTTRP